MPPRDLGGGILLLEDDRALKTKEQVKTVRSLYRFQILDHLHLLK